MFYVQFNRPKPLTTPEVAIPPEEDAVSIDAALAIRLTFTEDSLAVFALLDALAELLIASDGRTSSEIPLRNPPPPRQSSLGLV